MPDVQMPRLSDSMETGKIIRWLKQEGEEVKKGEPLVEIESDKANIEVEAYASGPLSKILVREGESAPIGAVIAQIGGGGEVAAAARPEVAVESAGEQYPQGSPDDRAEAGPAAQAALRMLRRGAPREAEGIKASPLARRLAEERRLDLSQIRGTGPEGRITREDVEAAAAALAPGAKPGGPPAPTPASAGPVEVMELSRMQATVASRMSQSKFSAPHFYVTSEIDMEDAIRLRDQFNRAVDASEAATVNDLVVRAVAMALTRFPQVNASWAQGRIERKREINIGIAVGLPDGLLVPVLHQADQKSLREIAKESRALVERARSGRALATDYVGSTFTVSNLGMYDVDQFTAIINPPDSAILAVGSILDKAVVKEGRVVAGKRMRLTLSVDHRVFYGVTAAQFLQEVKRLLEQPAALGL